MKRLIFLSLFTLFLLPLFAQNLDSLNFKADSLRDAGEFLKSVNLYKKVIAKDSVNTDALYGLAYCFYNIEELDKAISTLDNLSKLTPDDAKMYVLLSEVYSYKNSFDTALIYIDKAIELQPDSISYCIKQGSVYMLDNQLDKSLKSFQKAQKLDKYNPTVLYFTGYVYYMASYPDSALKYVNLALKFKDKADFHKLKAEVFYSQNRFSDAMFQIDKAIDIDGEKDEYILSKAEIYSQLGQYLDVLNVISSKLNVYNADFYNYAITSYINLQEADSAFYYINLAHKADPNNDLFYYLGGYLYYLQNDYNNSYINMRAAIELNPSNTDYFYMICFSKIMMNTDSSVFNFNDKFYDFNVANLSKMKKLSKSKKNKYYYKKLLSKFNFDPTSLGLDEYFMFYFGFALQSGFSGYANSNPLISDSYNREDYQTCIDLSIDFLKNHPCSVSTYFFLANSYYRLGDYDLTIRYLTIYYGFLDAILATGDGMSPENAYVVNSTSDEYAIFLFDNLTFAGQELLKQKKNYFDIMYYYENEKKLELYFNIDLFYGKK